MKVLIQLVVCIAVVWAVNGCVVDKERMGDADVKESDSVGNNKFSVNYERLLEKVEDRTPHNDNNHIVYRSYRVKEKQCIKLIVGSYEHEARAEMRGVSMPTGIGFQHSTGNFDSAVRFMDRTGITCDYMDEELELILPLHPNAKGTQYRQIRASCPNSSGQVSIEIGLHSRDSEKLAITVIDRDEEPTTYHAFDTNKFGQIIKHTRVVGDGQESVELDR